ncbi:MAG TPA: SDR family oxidoreductase [Puia sp.]|nr:SDR family oxidoreductase [Puia sp.]
MFSLENKQAVITGAGSGIGRAIALLFGNQKAQVHLVDINKDQSELLVREIEAGGGKACHHVCSVANQAQIDSIFASIRPIDILVNSAGVSHIGKAHTTSESDMDRLYQVNVKGVYNCLRAAIPVMRSQGGGVIVNICSIAALVGLQDRFAYSMSKGAVYSMTMSVARDYLAEKIRCNSISPARVHTPFVDGFIAKNYPGREKEIFEKLSKSQPIGRMATPEEIAALALYLSSDEASFITGTDYPIDGGFLKLNN